MESAPSHPSLEILAFEVGGRRFAIPASAVREVTRMVAILPLPQAPAIVEGVIDVRGEIVPVLDVRQRSGAPPKPPALDDHLIIAHAAGRAVALRVDRVTELVEVAGEERKGLRSVVPGVDDLSEVANLDGSLVLIDDLDAFLSADESRALAGALSEIGAEEGAGE